MRVRRTEIKMNSNKNSCNKIRKLDSRRYLWRERKIGLVLAYDRVSESYSLRIRCVEPIQINRHAKLRLNENNRNKQETQIGNVFKNKMQSPKNWRGRDGANIEMNKINWELFEFRLQIQIDR